MRVQRISIEAYNGFIQERPSVSPLQTPEWAGVKQLWHQEHIGWVNDSETLVGVALVLLLPSSPGYSLAYIPEGPLVEWHSATVEMWLAPLIAHFKQRGVQAIKMDPRVVVRKWAAASIRQAIANPAITSLLQVTPSEADQEAMAIQKHLAAAGWTVEVAPHGSYSKSQPRFVFQLSLADRDLDQIFQSFSERWRRSIRKSQRHSVQVEAGGAELLPEFCRLYAETAQRDGFSGRPPDYFETMHRAMAQTDPNRIRVYVARLGDQALAAAIRMTVGNCTWYMYGASSSERRDVQASTALQWQMIRDAHANGAQTYDLRGVTDAVDGSRHQGVLEFKLGTNGIAVEYLGTWTYDLDA